MPPEAAVAAFRRVSVQRTLDNGDYVNLNVRTAQPPARCSGPTGSGVLLTISAAEAGAPDAERLAQLSQLVRALV
jgi:hypothetical protein